MDSYLACAAGGPEVAGESAFWPQARDILHFVGICGAGKTTLSKRIAARCQRFGGKAIGTIDYDPDVPDHLRQDERAFSRELDMLNVALRGSDPLIHERIVQHALAMIESWRASDANAVIVDRWYESYDYLPSSCIDRIESAIHASGFRLCRIVLVVADSLIGDGDEEVRQRLLHTRAHRPDAWWETGPGLLDAWVREECVYQFAYRQLCRERRNLGPLIACLTTPMNWDEHEHAIVGAVIKGESLDW